MPANPTISPARHIEVDPVHGAALQASNREQRLGVRCALR